MYVFVPHEKYLYTLLYVTWENPLNAYFFRIMLLTVFEWIMKHGRDFQR